MKRFPVIFFFFLAILSACILATTEPMPPTETSMPPASTPEPTSTPIPSVALQRGINLGNMLEAPNEGDWGLTVQEEYFDLIKEAGFDFVRLPVRWNTHAEEEWPYTIGPAFFTRVDDVLRWALDC